MNKLETGTVDGWHSLVLDSGTVALTIPVDVGPRIMGARYRGGPNLFAVREDERGGRGEDTWRIRGGHRLWHAPEDPVRTYELDNTPIGWDALSDGGVRLRQPTEPRTGIAKEITVRFLAEDTVEVRHLLRNDGLWPVKLAPWALTVLRTGGYGIVPLPPKGTHPEDLLPAYHLVPWPYTDFTRPVWQFHREFIGIDMTKAADPQKLGIHGNANWLACWQEGTLFVKHAATVVGREYPDLGSANEVFSCDWMLEMETLGPLVELAPGATVEHVETWGFFGSLPHPAEEGMYARAIAPVIAAWRATHGLT